MTACENYCYKCYSAGEMPINCSGYHKSCSIHYRNIIDNENYFQDICRYCNSRLLVMKILCEYCFENPITQFYPNCKHYLCSNCSAGECKLCNLVNNLCINCNIYSKNIYKLTCSHLACYRCFEADKIVCNQCRTSKVCETCNNYHDNVVDRICGKKQCQKCFEKCSECAVITSKQYKSSQPCSNCNMQGIAIIKDCNHYGCNFCEHKSCTVCISETNLKIEPESLSIKNKKILMSSCIMCGENDVLLKKNCEHERCKKCIKKNCNICNIYITVGLCQVCNSPNNAITRYCNHNICDKCWKNKGCGICKKEQYHGLKECPTCKEPKVISDRPCGHERCCKECLRYLCFKCTGNNICDSCKALSQYLNSCSSKKHQVCATCENYCRSCKPLKECSNCGEKKNGFEISCECGYLCNDCKFLTNETGCILHSGNLRRCSDHKNCKFLLIDKILKKNCNNQIFCLACKKVIKKNSDRKKHKNCFKDKLF
jgi:hypothetical protein